MSSPESRVHRTGWFLRGTLTATALIVFVEAVVAGQFMSGIYPALAIHRELSTGAFVVAVLAVIAAVLARKRTPGWVWPTIGLLVLVTGQTLAGYMAMIWLHVPFAVALTVLSIGMAIWSWWKP